jgi:CheY-like chemotaxis protein/AraC-like DNA-binding protein
MPEEIVEDSSDRPLTHAQTASADEVGGRREQPGQDGETNGTPGRPSVLVVEDNSEVRRYIGSLLERDYRVYEAEDGLAGIESACEHMPDLIICDIMMPKLDGLELCRRLKVECSTSHIPVIMLTAKATMQDRINGLTIGADDYLVKPFDAGELKARIRNLLEQRKRLWEHFRLHGFDHPEAGSLTPVDRRFLERVQAIVTGHLSDPLFGVEVLASEMAVSRSLLFKKMHALLGESPSGLIRRMRLRHAAGLIGAGEGNISEIALEVGFSNPSYFAECFRKEYGVLPSHYRGPVLSSGSP